MKKFDSLIAEDLLLRINPSTQPTRLSSAISTCAWGGKQAEQVIIRGLELVANLPKKLYKHHKGELYEILHENATLKLIDADEPCIIYKSIKDGKIYVRTVSNFHEVILLKPHDLQSATKRFVEIDPFNQDIPNAKEV